MSEYKNQQNEAEDMASAKAENGMEKGTIPWEPSQVNSENGDARYQGEDVKREDSRQSGGVAVKRKSKAKENAKIIIKDVAIACAIAFAISIFIRPTLVKETSMEPTVYPNDYLIMSKQSYTFGKIRHGDIIVFKSNIKLDESHKKLLIKRVIGVAGDIITVSDGNVYRNGARLKEDYIAKGGTIGEIYNLEVPTGQVFVMGDHRSVSVDSRKLGCIKDEDIVGKAVFRLYPFNRMGGL